MAENSFLKKAWITARFILFGVFGFLLMLFVFVMLLDGLTAIHHEHRCVIQVGLVLACGLGAIMMLFGVGEWGRWGYLFVFFRFLFPFCSCSCFLMPVKTLVSFFQRSPPSALTLPSELTTLGEKGRNP